MCKSRYNGNADEALAMVEGPFAIRDCLRSDWVFFHIRYMYAEQRKAQKDGDAKRCCDVK